MPLFPRKSGDRRKELSVHVSAHRDGYRSVSIHGGTNDEVAELMREALRHFDGRVLPIHGGAIAVIEAPL